MRVQSVLTLTFVTLTFGLAFERFLTFDLLFDANGQSLFASAVVEMGHYIQVSC